MPMPRGENMAFPGRGQGGPSDTTSETGLAEVLLAFVTYGGQLGGARRLADNPLALTHVRWQGPAGQFLDAVRRPGDESVLTPAERGVWIDLALHFPEMLTPVASGVNAPWFQLTIDREAALALSAKLVPSRSAGTGAIRSTPPPNPSSQPRRDAFTASSLHNSGIPPLAPPWGRTSGGRVPSGAPNAHEPMEQVTGGWRFREDDMPELFAFPCVEVELPSAVNMPTAEYARDSARDVAVHFARAAQAIPQVRDLRAWMRGDRLVLAACVAMGRGSRPLTRTDLDSAAQLLADELARRTIPYVRLTFADPAEWQAGSPMPE
jgi:hypothetical protein